jgi:hypothetical protein
MNQDLYDLVKHLKQQGYDLFNSYDNFYNDICSPYKSLDNTDVLLNDRKYDFYDSNITLCEDTCQYKEFDIISLKAKCQCNIKTEVKSDNDVKFVPNKIIENFYKIEKYTNIRVAICYNLVFSLKGQTYNYGSYILIGISFCFLIIMIATFATINNTIKSLFKRISVKYISIIEELNKKIEKNSSLKGKVKTKNNKKNNSKSKFFKTTKKNKVNNPKKKKNFKQYKQYNNTKNTKINRKKIKMAEISASIVRLNAYKDKLNYIDK